MDLFRLILQIAPYIGSIVILVGVFVGIIRAIYNFLKKPKLEIVDQPTIRNWQYVGTRQTRRFFTLEVKNKRKLTAKRCEAVAKVIKGSSNIGHLLNPCPLHWSRKPYSTLSTGADPIEIGATAERLDVAFTVPTISGASWLALSLALSYPGQTGQAMLPQGEYVIEVQVSCENGRGASKKFKLISPQNWQDLDAIKL